MSGMGWQDAVTALIVLGAVGYLVWRKLGARKNALPCGDCPGCAGSAPGAGSASAASAASKSSTPSTAPQGEVLVRITPATDARGGPATAGR